MNEYVEERSEILFLYTYIRLEYSAEYWKTISLIDISWAKVREFEEMDKCTTLLKEKSTKTWLKI